MRFSMRFSEEKGDAFWEAPEKCVCFRPRNGGIGA
jgi:hypothetical protein